MPLFAKPSCVANSTDLSVQGLIQSDKGSFFTYIEVQENPMDGGACAGRDRGQEEKGTTEDKMVGWHH